MARTRWRPMAAGLVLPGSGRTMRRAWRRLGVLMALSSLLAGCACQAESAGQAASAPPSRRAASTPATPSATGSAARSVSATPTPTASVTAVRGAEISSVPDWVSDPDQQLAARFVILANTPDGQVDESATGAWRRAATLASPDLAADMASGRGAMGGQFAQVKARKGWVSVSIDNVLGGAQAPGADAGSGPIPILFTQSIHVGSEVTRDQTTQEWDVTVFGGKVIDFDAKES